MKLITFFSKERAKNIYFSDLFACVPSSATPMAKAAIGTILFFFLEWVVLRNYRLPE